MASRCLTRCMRFPYSGNTCRCSFVGSALVDSTTSGTRSSCLPYARAPHLRSGRLAFAVRFLESPMQWLCFCCRRLQGRHIRTRAVEEPGRRLFGMRDQGYAAKRGGLGSAPVILWPPFALIERLNLSFDLGEVGSELPYRRSCRFQRPDNEHSFSRPENDCIVKVYLARLCKGMPFGRPAIDRNFVKRTNPR